jgi:hypothetical protein
MRRPTLPARIAGIAALALVALALPSGALAAPTGSQIAAPSDPAFARYDADAPSTLHVAGTTSGGTGDVDLRCYFGATSGLVAAGVAVSGGSFTADVPVTKALVSALADPQAYCVLRAVPTGTAPAAPPGQASAFQGPHIGWGWAQTNPIGAGNDPNPAELLQDYYVSQAQAQAFNDYDSAGDCGLCDTYLFDPTTFARSNPIWWANAWLQYKVTGSITPRSSVQVDGVDVYNPHAAWSVAGYALADNPGLPGLTVTNEVDPANGNVTITETDPFASCTPQPATYPPTDASCASFSPPVVKLVRKISQHDHGLQVTIADHWQSLDGQPHQLDAMYADENRNANYATVGHEGRWDFTGLQDLSGGHSDCAARGRSGDRLAEDGRLDAGRRRRIEPDRGAHLWNTSFRTDARLADQRGVCDGSLARSLPAHDSGLGGTGHHADLLARLLAGLGAVEGGRGRAGADRRSGRSARPAPGRRRHPDHHTRHSLHNGRRLPDYSAADDDSRRRREVQGPEAARPHADFCQAPPAPRSLPARQGDAQGQRARPPRPRRRLEAEGRQPADPRRTHRDCPGEAAVAAPLPRATAGIAHR